MAKRKRNIQILFCVSPEEKKLIRRKMIESKTKNMGAYLRKMAIDGYIVNTDTTPLKKQYEEMHKIGVNINQIAKKVNSTGDLYPEEKQELKEMVKELWRILRLLWSSIFVTLMANKIGGLQFGIYRNCQISSRVFHTAVAALPLTKANRSDFE